MSTNTTPSLNRLLADYTVYYQKLRFFHWTVQGPHFFTLHEKFEEMYLGAAERIDELAERIVALGGRPLGRLADVVEQAQLEEDRDTQDAAAMVRAVLDDQARLAKGLRALAAQTEEGGDRLTTNLLEDLADGEEKDGWMLRAFLA